MKVLLFLAEGFEDLEAVSILDIFGWTEYRDWVPTVEVVTTGFHKKVNSRFGLQHSIDIAFENLNPEDYMALALPGGFHSHGFDEAYDERLHELCRRIHNNNAWIATFCVGVLPVAEAGLLKDKRAVTYPYSQNHNNTKRLKELGAHVVDSAVAIDNRIISCAGPGSSLDVTFYLLEALLGTKHCNEVKRLMCVPNNNNI